MQRLFLFGLILFGGFACKAVTNVVPKDSSTPDDSQDDDEVDYTPKESLAEIVAGAAVRLATGLEFTEGPLWHPDGFLLFSEFRDNRIYRWKEGEGLTTYLEAAGTNGLTLDKSDQLVACRQNNRQVERRLANGNFTVIAARYDGKRLNKPNDCVVTKNGDVYFTDPDYGLTPPQKELGFTGVYRVSPAGAIERVAAATPFIAPNGLAFSPNEDRLYVSDATAGLIYSYAVAADGTIGAGSVFAMAAVPDGLKVDRHGHLYVSSSAGIVVIHPDGRKLGTISVPEAPANCAFGGDDARTLFVTARTSLYRIPLLVPGVAPGKP